MNCSLVKYNQHLMTDRILCSQMDHSLSDLSYSKQNKSKFWKTRLDSSDNIRPPLIRCNSAQHLAGNSELFPVWRHSFCNVAHSWHLVGNSFIADCVDKKEDSRIQSDMEELIAKSNQNKFQLNESKCKELRITFGKSAADWCRCRCRLCSHCYQLESNRGSVHC